MWLLVGGLCYNRQFYIFVYMGSINLLIKRGREEQEGEEEEEKENEEKENREEKFKFIELSENEIIIVKKKSF